MSEEQKQGKQLKSSVKLKTKPAVVPTSRKIKRKGPKIPKAMKGSKGLKMWNIIFTIIFGALLVLTLVNSYFKEFIIIPIPNLFLKIIIPILIFIEVFLVLLAFETYKVTFAPKLIRIILTIVTLIIFFPLTLFKYHTRHNIWRIMFVGLTIGALLLSFFSPYFNMIGKYRDLPPGEIELQEAGQSWFNTLFQGSAPFFIDGFLDFLDSIGWGDDALYAQVHSPSGQLGNFLYRWQISDVYDSSTWEFVSNDAVSSALTPGDYGPNFNAMESSDIIDLQITQNVTSGYGTTAILNPILSTWSNLHPNPHIEQDLDWDDNVVDGNGTTSAVDGTAKVRFNDRKQFLLSATSTVKNFYGFFNYNTYLAYNNATVRRYFSENCLTAVAGGYNNPSFINTYSPYLHIPTNYDTISPLTYAYGTQLKNDGNSLGNTVYQQVLYVIDRVLQEQGPIIFENEFVSYTGDRAEGLMAGTYKAFSAFITLVVMALRLCGIPARPVYGFALGDGDASNRNLYEHNFYSWLEVLLPIDESPVTKYYWGQFQVGPYPDGLVYCENTLYSTYNITFEMLGGPPGYATLTSQSYSGEDVYITEYDTTYTLQADVTSEGTPVPGATVTFRSVLLSDFQTYYETDPGFLLSLARDIGTDSTNVAGRVRFYTMFDSTNYTQFDIATPSSTIYVIIAQVSLTAMDGKCFLISPEEGYISDVTLNATQRLETIPENPPNQDNYYIVQKSLVYQISSHLYEDEAFTTPLVGRNVTYYVMNSFQQAQLVAGTLDLEDLAIGWAFTDGSGYSVIYSYNSGTDYFFDLSIDTTYYVVALFGQNYTNSIMLVYDDVYSTLDVNDTYLNVEIDGSYMFEDFDFSLYFETGGTPEPIANQYVEFWMAPESVYSSYSGTDPEELKNDYLLVANASAPYNVQIVAYGLTDVNGYFNTTFKIDAYIYGSGDFVVIAFYMGRFNASVIIKIETPPAALSITEGVDSTQINLNLIEENNIIISNYEREIILFNLYFIFFFSKDYESNGFSRKKMQSGGI